MFAGLLIFEVLSAREVHARFVVRISQPEHNQRFSRTIAMMINDVIRYHA